MKVRREHQQIDGHQNDKSSLAQDDPTHSNREPGHERQAGQGKQRQGPGSFHVRYVERAEQSIDDQLRVDRVLRSGGQVG